MVDEFEGHACRQAFHQLSAFGIETAEQLLLWLTAHVLLRPLIHVLAVVVALTLGLAINGQHAGEQAVPLAEEVLSHLVIIEKVAVVASVVAVADVEVEHPPRVGSQLVVAGIE